MLSLLACRLASSAQLAWLQADLPLTPLRIVGYEGLFGSIGSLLLVLPLAQLLPGEEGQGIHEDSLDTLHVSFMRCCAYCMR